MSVRAVPIRDASGEIAEWFGMNIDITEQKNAANALRESEERFRLFMENSPVYAWVKDEDGRYVYLSPTYERRFGLNAAASLGKTAAELWPPDVAAGFQKNDLAALSAERPIDAVEEARNPDGSKAYGLVTKFRFCNSAGKRYVGGIGLDITERRRMEAALHAGERRFHAIFNHQFLYTVLVSPEGRVVEASDSVLRGTGVAPEAVIGHSFIDGPWWRDLPEMRERWRRQFEEAKARPGPSQDEADYLTSDGELRYALNTVTALRDEQGELEFFLCEGLDITERKRAEAALRASERRFRAVFKNQLAYSALLTPEGRLVDASDVALRATGVALEEIIGLPFLDGPWWKDLPEMRARWRRQFEEALARPGPARAEVEYRLGDGLRHALNSVTALRDEQGELEYFLCEGIDITERKRAEDALRESEERLRLALEASHAGSWAWDAVSNVSSWDEGFRALYGFPQGAPQRFDAWIERLHPEDRNRILSRIERLRATPGDDKWNEEFRSVSPEASLRWHQGLGQARRDASGALVKMVGIDLDITERKQAENALRESEERLRRVSDNADVGLIRTNRELIYLSANPAYAKIVGKPLEQIIGRPLSEVMGVQAAESIRPYVERVLRGERFTYEAELPYVGAGKRYVQVSNAPEVGAAGEIGSWVTCVVDVTERKRAEIALREADRRKDEFLATLAHELRNPLAPVRNGLEALRNLGAQDEPADRLLAVMEAQVDHLIRLVNDLMDISRISQGKFELQKQRMDLATALSQAINMSRHLLEAEGLELKVKLPSSPTPVEGDAVRLTQVFANLLSNAAKHTKRGGRVEIALEQVADEAVAHVADTGAGIAKELLPLIFEPFVQGRGKSGGPEQGLGIGLALVRQITEMHGGAVEARSEGEGLGSAFIVRLPLLGKETTETPVEIRAPARLATASRVLVIDDMPQVAQALAFLLDVLGATVRVAHSGEQGLEFCAEFEPDLVLLDLSMPIMDGFETARRLKELPAGRRARLVAVTGFGEQQSLARTQEAGFESHLVKPVRLQQLEALLASVGAAAAQQTTAE